MPPQGVFSIATYNHSSTVDQRPKTNDVTISR
jgi:hypothetical protein